jgi:hypothetical protein
MDVVGVSGTEQLRIGNTIGGTDFGITVTENASTIINSAEGATGRGIQFQSGGVNTMLLDSSGNLGLGVTPSAWVSGSVSQTISNAVVARRNNGASVFGHNFYESAANTFTYTQTGVATRIEAPTAGGLTFNTAPSGTAGTAITFTERANIGLTEMVVNDPGNDYDFRVESDTNTHALFVDAGNNMLASGTSTPATYLDAANDGFALKGATAVDYAMVSSSVASGSNSHQIRFWNDTGTAYEIARLRVNVGAGQVNRGEFQLSVNNGAGLRPFLDVDYAGNVVFNQQGYDSDFQIKSVNRSHMLFVDASTDQVTMGQSTPRANATLTLGYSGISPSYNAQLSIDANASSGTGQAVVELLAGSGSTNRASRINFLNGVTSTTAPRWTLINDFDQNGTNDLRLVNAASWSMMEFTQSGGVVFNEGSNDIDFRVESNDNTHALFVDAGNSYVGVNTNAPRNVLDVDVGTNASFLVLQANRANAGTTSSLNAQLFTISVPYSNGGAGVGGSMRVFVNASAESGLNACANRSAVFDIVISRTGANSGGGNTDVDVQITELTNATSSVGAPTISDIGLTASNPAASAATQTVDINITGTSNGSYIWRVYATIQYMGWETITFSNLT